MNELLIEKSKTALVVIDLQKGITNGNTEPYPVNIIIENAAKLAKKFRENKIPVFLVRVTPSSDYKDGLTPQADNPMQINIKPAEDWANIVPELESKDDIYTFIITKRQWGAFYGTELDLQLRRRKINTIVLCGISTNIGVESTARFAYEYGYEQIFAENATSARTKEEHEHTMNFIFPKIGKVRKTEDIIKALE